MRHHRNNAFTLIELLVVVAVIALLIGLLLPALGRARSSAIDVTCQSQQRQIGTALALYADDYSGTLPYGGVWQPNAQSGFEGSKDWTLDIMTYMNGTAESYTEETTIQKSNKFGTRELFYCGRAVRITDDFFIMNTYAVHPRLMPDWNKRDLWAQERLGVSDVRMKPKNYYTVGSPSQTLTATDTGQDARTVAENNFIGGYHVSPTLDRLDNKALDKSTSYLVRQKFLETRDSDALNESIDGGPNVVRTSSTASASIFGQDADSYGNIRWRHGSNETANVLYLDGHVDPEKYFTETDTTITQLSILLRQ